MNFNNGNDNNNNKNNSNYVRAVRGGKYPLFSFESVYRAYIDCRKRKRGTINALRFEADVLEGLFQLAVDLQKGTYQPSRSICFITRTPKLREIFAADFRDRVIHHLVVRELEKTWEPRFIYDSYACRLDKGIHVAVERLQKFMLKASKNQKKAAYFIQLDIRSFFMSIDKQILFERFELEETELKELLKIIIFHDCTKDYYFRGQREVLEQIPPHKSLFKVGSEKGLPIGNLTSQFFANVYLNELDQFVKHQLRCRFYLRYVDDFILLSEEPKQLLEWQSQIEIFLKEHLKLELKAGSYVKRVSEGADFLGYIVRPDYMLVRRRVVNNLKYKLAMFKKEFLIDNVLTLEPEKVAELRQTLASYLGHFKHAQTYNLLTSIIERHKWLEYIFTFENNTLHERLKQPKEFKKFRSQWLFFKSRLNNFLLFCKVGKFVELYDEDAAVVKNLFKLNSMESKRGMKDAVGFPERLAQVYIKQIFDAGYCVAFIEQGDIGKHIRQRYVLRLYIAARLSGLS